jgi:hypothetical protein
VVVGRDLALRDGTYSRRTKAVYDARFAEVPAIPDGREST